MNEALFKKNYLTEQLVGAGFFGNCLYQAPIYFCEFQILRILQSLVNSKLCGFPLSRSIIATLHAKFRFKILSELINRKHFFVWFFAFLFVFKIDLGITHLRNEKNFIFKVGLSPSKKNLFYLLQ